MKDNVILMEIDKPLYETIHSVQYDRNSRFVHVKLLNNSLPFDLTNKRVILSGSKPDGEEVFNTCKIEEDLVVIEITEDMNAVPGISEYSLEIYGGDMSLLQTKNFKIKVTPSNRSKAIESRSEVKALTDALSEVQNIDNRFAETNAQLSEIENHRKAQGNIIYATDFGVVANDIHADDNFANSNALIEIEKVISKNLTDNSMEKPRYTIILPAGKIYFKKNNLNFLSRNLEGHPCWGLVVKGQGIKSTQIVYQPSEPSYFIYNNNNWGSVYFEDFSFTSDTREAWYIQQVDKESLEITPKASFYHSKSNPYPQNIHFRNIEWSHIDYCIHLEGGDCNSEYKFHSCLWRGVCEKIFYNHGDLYSEQSLNHDFYSCDVQLFRGDFITLESGGNVNVYGGCYIHKPMSDESLVNRGGTFFKLLGGWHPMGVSRLNVNGARFETSYDRKSKLIYSEWGSHGNILFDSCDDSALCYHNNHELHTQAEFVFKLDQPVTTFQNCMLYGKHLYKSESGRDHYLGRANYNDCLLGNTSDVNDFIVVESGAPNIFVNGITLGYLNTDGSGVIPTTTYINTQILPNKTSHSIRTKKYLNIKAKSGVYPYRGNPTVKAKLPLNSIITKIILYASEGYCTATATNDFKFYYNETEKNLIFSKTDGKQCDGLNVMFDCFIPLNTVEDCEVIFESNGDQPGFSTDEMFALIEYM